jgi:hypothetical protein
MLQEAPGDETGMRRKVMWRLIRRLLGLCVHKWAITNTHTRRVIHYDEFPALVGGRIQGYWADQVVTTIQCEKCSKVEIQMTPTHRFPGVS